MNGLSKVKWVLVLFIVILAIVTIFSTAVANEGEQALETARKQVEENGTYSFTADIEQTLIPRPVVSMIGETSQRVDMRLDGEVDGPETARLQLRFEGEGDNVQPLIFEQEGQDSYLLKDGERIKIDSPTAGALPTANMMTYLAAAENVALLDAGDYPAPEGYSRYAFDISGTRLAQVLQSQSGSAGGSADLALSPTLKNTTGSGELWVDENGLPRRQIIDLEIPEVTDEYNTTVHMIVDYRYGEGAAAAEILPGYLTAAQPQQSTQSTNQTITNYQLPITNLLTQLLILTAFSLLIVALIFGHRYRRLYGAVAVSLSLIFLFSPLMKVMSTGHAVDVAEASTQTLPEALGVEDGGDSAVSDEGKNEPVSLTDRSQALNTPTYNTRVQNQVGTTVCGEGDDIDTDMDGLTDNVENCLGTDPGSVDSDRDLLTDTLEINGFDYYSRTWYLDPLSVDTNRDGLPDASEWISPTGSAPSWDIDGDHIPNPWDDDNDGDGVWDSLDLSPYSVTGYQNSFSFTTQIENNFNGYQYFEIQFQPQDPTHLRYTTSYLDWPDDELGQLTDLDGSTEDVFVSPMLAITTDQVPDTVLGDMYNVSDFPNDDGSYTLYVPAQTIADGGQIVGFSGKVAYGPSTTNVSWDDVRLVWTAYMAVDSQANGSIETTITPLATYEEDIRITGWQISKYRDSDYLLMGTPNSPHDDRDMFQLIFGLSSTYMSNLTPDLDTLDTRFSNSNTDPILTWGVPAADVEVYRPATAPGHPDMAVLDMGGQIPIFLNSAGYPTDGDMVTLAMVTEQEGGMTNMDDFGSQTQYDVNLSNISVGSNRSVRMGAYAYNNGWESLSGDEMLNQVASRYDDLSSELATLLVDYPLVNQTHLEKTLIIFYMQWFAGQTRVITIDGVDYAKDGVDDAEVYARLNLLSDSLAIYLMKVAGILEEGGGVKIDDSAGLWSYLRADNDSETLWVPSYLSWLWDAGGIIFQTDSNFQIYFAYKAILGLAIGVYCIYWVVSLARAAQAAEQAFKWFSWITLSTKWAKFTAVIGTVVAVIFYWVIFALTTDFSNPYETGMAIAYYTVATVFAIVLLIISLTGVGAILVGLFYLLDAIIFLITFFVTGKGISIYEEILQETANFFYNATSVSKLNSADFLGIHTSVQNGTPLTVGARFLVTDTLQAELESENETTQVFNVSGNDGDQSVDATYAWGKLTGTVTDTSIIVVDINDTSSVLPDAENRTCTVDGNKMTCENEAGVMYYFTAAGLNFDLTFKHSVFARTWIRECTLSSGIGNGSLFCWYDKEDINFPEDLDEGWDAITIQIDIIPNTLDGLWNWDALSNPDADGDDLTAAEEAAVCINNGATCLDPDNWDTDGDGLSDSFEVNNADLLGTNALVADTDGDGLKDGEEYRWGTLINTTDSDGDGLTDNEEIFHQLSNGTWAGGGWLVNVPGGNGFAASSYWMFSDPRQADADSDGLNDATEKANSLGPDGYNPAPQLVLDVQPAATSPSGHTGAYLGTGDAVVTTVYLDSIGPKAITETLQLCLPDSLSITGGGTMQGSRKPPVVQTGNCFSWSFSGQYKLQRWETVSTTITANVSAVSSQSGSIDASLPYSVFGGNPISATMPVIIDAANPNAAIINPADGAIIGGGISAYVVGGTSSDADSWVTQVDVTLPGQGTVGITETVNAWAATWNLPADGVYNLTAQATDYVGNSSAVDSIQVTVDNTTPTATLSLADHEVVSGIVERNQVKINLNGTAADNLSGLERIQISMDDKPWRTVWNEAGYPTNATWSTVWTLPGGEWAHGEHTILVRAIDRAGNIGSSVEKTVIVDVVPPSDDLTSSLYLSDPPHFKSGDTVNLYGVANDSGNLPLAPVPADLNGTLHSIDDATIWLYPNSVADNSSNMTVTWIGDFNGDGLADLAVGLPASADGDGRVVVVNGQGGDWPVPDLGVALSDASTSFKGVTGAGIGSQVAPAGDVNGDGLSDLLIGDTSNNRLFLVFGTAVPQGKNRVLETDRRNRWSVLTVSGASLTGQFAGAGDVNGDGYDDILVAASNNRVHLLLGQFAPTWTTIDLATYAAATVISGSASVAGVGDVNNDQLGDFALGVGSNVYLFSGMSGLSAFGNLGLTTADALASYSSDSQAQIVPLGDVNGDTLPDFIFENGTTPTIVFGDAGNSFSTQTLGGFSPAADGFLAAAGDVDRDNQNDIVIGNAAGDAYLFLGSDLSTVEATLTGVDSAASAPYAAGADINSDGASDLLLIPSDSAVNTFGADLQPPFIDPSWLPQGSTAVESVGEQGRGGFLNGFLLAVTHYVDDDGGCDGQTPCYTTIQAAVDAASAGDTIEILPGVYISFTVTTDDLIIQGSTLADAVFVDGAGGTFAAKISNADGVQLRDLTLRNADYGLWLETAGEDGWQTPADKIIVQRVLIHDFNTHAVYMNQSSTLSLMQSTLAGNTNHIGVYGSSSIDRSWSTEATDNRSKTDSNSQMVSDGTNLIFVGGNDTNNIYRYNPVTNSWTTNSGALGSIGSVTNFDTVAAETNGDLFYLQSDPFLGGFSKGSAAPASITDILYVSNSEIYAAGSFSMAGGVSGINNIAKWNGSAWVGLGEGDANKPGSIKKMARDSNGYIWTIGYNGLHRWNGASWSYYGNSVWATGGSNGFDAIFIIGSDIYLGGKFESISPASGGSVNANDIVKFNGSTWSRLAGNPTNCSGTIDTSLGWNYGKVNDFALANLDLIIVGEFKGMYNGSCSDTVLSRSIIRYNLATNTFKQMSTFGSSGSNNSGFWSTTNQCCDSNTGELYSVYVTSGGGNFIYVSGSFEYVDWGYGTLASARGMASYIWSPAVLDINILPGEVASAGSDNVSDIGGLGLFGLPLYLAGPRDFGWAGGAINSGWSTAILDDFTNTVSRITDPALYDDSAQRSSTVEVVGTNAIFIGGSFHRGTMGLGFFKYDGTAVTQSHFRKYSGGSWTEPGLPTNINKWVGVGQGSAITSDGQGNFYALLDYYGCCANYKGLELAYYDGGTGSWSLLSNLSGSGLGATMTYADNTLYFFKGGSGTEFCSYNGSLNCSLASVPYNVGAGAGMAFDGGFYIYAMPGSNGKQLIRYNMLTDTWETLGDGSGTTTTDDDIPVAVNDGGGMTIIGNELYITPGGDSNVIYKYGPVGIYQERLQAADVAIVAPSNQGSSTWTTGALADTFVYSSTNTVLVGGNSTNWSPDYNGILNINTTEVNHTTAAFLDAGNELYRLTAASAITAGYHTYRPDAYVAASGEEFSSVQDAVDSGANRVLVKAGSYEETFSLASGVSVIGAGAGQTIIEPPNNITETTILNIEGTIGSSFAGFTLAGDGTIDGFHAEDGATDISFFRNIVRDTGTAVQLDGSGTDVELYNLTLVSNVNGVDAINCAPVDVRNTIFAYNSGTGLAYQGCAPTKLHVYNDYWLNDTDQSPLAPGSGEIFLDPLFEDLAAFDYRVLDGSPIIDAGAPSDPAPPGAGVVDMGYLEQTAAAFYADDDYCDTCINDGLQWGVTAFQTIQEAVDAAESELLSLASPNLRYTVGVGPGTYSENVAMAPYVYLTGSDADAVIIDPASGTAVVFSGTVHSGVNNVTLAGDTGVSVQNANSISITRNLIEPANVGVVLTDGGSANIQFNTLVSGTAGIQASGSGTWATAENNILSGNTTGLISTSSGQIFSNFNLLYNTTDYSGVTGGADDIAGQDPLFAVSGYTLQAASPAVDAASPQVKAPTGGGRWADMGYAELQAKPFTVFLGDDDVSRVIAFTGINQVEYAVVAVGDPSLPITATLPISWSTAALSDQGDPVSFWNATYLPPSAGTYRLYTRAEDEVNNQETNDLDWYAGSFVVDDTGPTVTVPSGFAGFSATSPVALKATAADYADGTFSVKNVYFLIDGVAYPAEWSAEPWQDDGSTPRPFRAYVTLPNGSYTVIAVAEDKAGNVSQSSSITLDITGQSIDSTPPTLAVSSPTNGSMVTGTVQFTGTASDAGSGLASVEVSIDNGVSWMPTYVTSGTWNLEYALPDGENLNHPTQVRAKDEAGNTTIQSLSFSSDSIEPDGLVPIEFSTPPGTHFDVETTLFMTWTTPYDGSGTADVLVTANNLTYTVPTSPTAGNTASFVLSENQDWYVHIAAVDAVGNANYHVYGPWEVGSTDDFSEPLANRDQTILIDGYLDIPHNEWTADEKLDDDERGLAAPVGATQELYATWDGENLFVGWQDAWWAVDGTLWAYLDTEPGGTNQTVSGAPFMKSVTNPVGRNQTVSGAPFLETVTNTLPFNADYALMVTGPDTADGLLWTYSGGSWSSSPLQFAQGDSGDTEIRFPISVDAISTLRLLAFAEDDAGTPWSVFPTTNDLMTWTDYYEWTGLENIALVNSGQPLLPGVTLDLSSVEPANVTLGPDDTINYLLDVSNLETKAVNGLQVQLTADPKVAFQSVTGATCTSCSGTQNWTLTLPDLSPSSSIIVTVSAQLDSDLSGLVNVTSAANLRWLSAPFQNNTHKNRVDGNAPTATITLPPGGGIGVGSETVYGTASDGGGGGVDSVEVRLNGAGGWIPATGKQQWKADVTVSGGPTWLLEARAIDVHGLVGEVVSATFTVDGVGPLITPTLPTIVNGDFANLTGTAVDPIPTGGLIQDVFVQVDSGLFDEAELFSPNPDSSQNWLFTWDLPSEDGVTHSLVISATDNVGNIGLSGPHNIIVDTISPVLTPTQLLTDIGLADTSDVLSGTVSDGLGVQEVQVAVYAPDGSTFEETAVLNGNQWTFSPTNRPALGQYDLWVTAVDTAGNETLSGPFVIFVVGALTIADISIDEAAGTAEATVTLSDTSFVTLTVDYLTADNVAVAPDDYTAVTGTLTIPAGSITGTISIPIIDDNLDENDELFNLILNSPVHATISDGTADILIVDDDFTPVANDDFYETIMETTLVVSATNGVLANDTDGDNDVLTAVLDNDVSQGDLVLNSDGSFVYTPTVDFWGEDAFSYYASDGTNNSAAVTVTINVKVDLAPFVLLATDGVSLKQGVTVQSGGIGVNSATDGPYLENGVELSLDMDVTIIDPSAPVMGDSIYIETGAQVYDVYYNELFNYGTISGTETTPLDLPVVPAFPELPTFTPGTENVRVRKDATEIVDAGSYNVLKASVGATVIFSGGVYDFASWDVGQEVNLYFEAPTEIRIADKLYVNQMSYVGPSPAATNLDATDIVIYVAGINGNNGNINGNPQAATFTNNVTLIANVFVPNGTLFIGQETQATGGFLAKWIQIQKDAILMLESGW